MRVMMLLKGNAESEAGGVPDQKLLTDMGNYNEAMVNAGVALGGEGLHPTSQGAKVRIVKGKTIVVDGPFAEAKEVIAGFFLLQTKSLQEAIEWAKRIPGDDSGDEGELELRPLYETEDFPVDPQEQPGGWRDQELELRAKPKAPGPEHGQRYISFLKADEFTEAKLEPNEKVLAEMGALIQEMSEKNVLITGEGLKPSSDSVKIKLSKNKRVVVDGPFTEAKEIVAGYTVYRAKTKAEAIEWARRWLQIHVEGTGAEAGEIEVRRVFETEEIPVSPDETSGGWRDQELRLRERLGQ
jgi:hypothetical protein